MLQRRDVANRQNWSDIKNDRGWDVVFEAVFLLFRLQDTSFIRGSVCELDKYIVSPNRPSSSQIKILTKFNFLDTLLYNPISHIQYLSLTSEVIKFFDFILCSEGEAKSNYFRSFNRISRRAQIFRQTSWSVTVDYFVLDYRIIWFINSFINHLKPDIKCF